MGTRGERILKVAISQPTYLPWLGYFDLMAQADQFVFLDSVQFEKQSWQHRNRIKTPLGLQWLTVPVVFRGHFGQPIQDVRIREPEFARLHLRAIELNYRRCAFFERYYDEMAEVLQRNSAGLLSDLNLALIRWFCAVLNLSVPFLRSSEMHVEGRRSERLIDICRSLGADQYLSPIGSKDYLLEDSELFSRAGISIFFQNYVHPDYCQAFPPFCPYASALDLIFNEGPNSRRVVESGRRQLFGLEDVAALPEVAS